MIKSSLAMVLLASVVGTAGCASRAETVGAATGVAVGAGLGGGAMGTVGGAMVGYAIGRTYDQRQRN